MSKNNNEENIYGDNYNSPNNNNVPKKKRKQKVIIINTIIILISLIFAVSGGGLLYYYNLLNSVSYESEEDYSSSTSFKEEDSATTSIDLADTNLVSDPKVLNIMLFGSDKRKANDAGRSDSMILVSLDNRNKKIKMTSIMRDIWVHIPGYKDNRINVAYSLGGPAKAIETVERNFGIKIDRYVVADFDGFSNIIDRLGGIDLELTAAEVKYINSFCGDKYTLRGSGLLHVNGEQALNHARNRDSAMSDFDRTRRQRQVLQAMLAKVKTANLSQITGIVADVGPMVSTNLKKDEISKLVLSSLTYLKYDVEEFRLPETNNYSNKVISGMWVLAINDMSKARYNLAKFIYEDSIQ